MKLKSAIKYRYSKLFKISLVFYILMLELVIGSFIVKAVNRSDFAFDEFFVFIMLGFVFALGIFSYTGELNMLLQNGVSRQSIHKSFIAILPVNIAFAVISIIYDYFDYLSSKSINPKVEFYFNPVFPGVSLTMPKSMFAQLFINITLITVFYMTFMCFGYMISAISRSMKLFYKVLIGSVIIAVFVFAGVLYDTYSVEWFEYVFMLVRGLFLGAYLSPQGRVGNFIAAMLVLCVINLSVAHLLINRATVKKGTDKK